MFCAIGLCFGLVDFSAEYVEYALLAPSRSLPAGEAFAWLSSWVWVGGLGLVVFLDLLFPDGTDRHFISSNHPEEMHQPDSDWETVP